MIVSRQKDLSIDVILENATSVNALGSDCGIYFLLSGKTIVYVGQTQNLYIARVIAHLSEGKEFDSYFALPCPPEELSNWEAYFILKFQPFYNSSIPKNTWYASIMHLKKTWGMTKHEIRKLAKKHNIAPTPYGDHAYYSQADFAIALGREGAA